MHVLRSKGYKEDLEDLSLYAAHIKQERPMLYILAKHLSKRGFAPILEKKIGDARRPYDLVVDNTKIEAKFYYEGDLERRFMREMEDVGWSIDSLIGKLESLKKEKRGTSWKMALAIIKDLYEKIPEIFMLIILSRDLRGIKEPKLLEQICWAKYEKKYNKYNDWQNLQLVNEFLKCMHASKKMKRQFRSDSLEIPIENKMFRSLYHIYFCDFIPARA